MLLNLACALAEYDPATGRDLSAPPQGSATPGPSTQESVAGVLGEPLDTSTPHKRSRTISVEDMSSNVSLSHSLDHPSGEIPDHLMAGDSQDDEPEQDSIHMADDEGEDAQDSYIFSRQAEEAARQQREAEPDVGDNKRRRLQESTAAEDAQDSYIFSRQAEEAARQQRESTAAEEPSTAEEDRSLQELGERRAERLLRAQERREREVELDNARRRRRERRRARRAARNEAIAIETGTVRIQALQHHSSDDSTEESGK